MWGPRECRASRFFRINPGNFSGRRLYALVGPDVDFIVTNACSIMQTHASKHGIPDAAYVRENLLRLEPFALLLVCGTVARKAYRATGYEAPCVMEIRHPAARSWTKKALAATTKEIRRKLIDPRRNRT
jgi:hypothetical protein